MARPMLAAVSAEAAGTRPQPARPAAGAVLVTFVLTELIHEPASIAMLLIILALSIALDFWWKQARHGRVSQVQVSH